jgi:transcriptional regulator with XRE-family HTH domain
VTSYTKWDRDAYIERAGGPEEAERRRKTLMARQSGQRLAGERKHRGLTQAQLAQTMGVTPGRVSQIERGELSTIEAIARYVQALGGRLDLVATSPTTPSQSPPPKPPDNRYPGRSAAGDVALSPARGYDSGRERRWAAGGVGLTLWGRSAIRTGHEPTSRT